VAEIFRVSALNLKNITNGAEGILITEIPPLTFGATIITDWSGKVPFYYTGLMIAFITILASFLVKRSKLGYYFQAIREDLDAAQESVMAILEVKHVSKFFGGLAANSDVSFEVAAGEIVGLIGPNGAGKTTLFNCITGYYPPSRGEVLFDGRRMNGLQPDRVC